MLADSKTLIGGLSARLSMSCCAADQRESVTNEREESVAQLASCL